MKITDWRETQSSDSLYLIINFFLNSILRLPLDSEDDFRTGCRNVIH